MARKNIKRITTPRKQVEREPEKNFPRVSLRPGVNDVQPSARERRNIQKSRFNKTPRTPLTKQVSSPIKFLDKLDESKADVCFVVGGGPSLTGFDFTLLNGFETIAVNKAVEFLSNPTYFVTTDYSYFVKANLSIEQINMKVKASYFVANMSHPYMEYQSGKVIDTRRNYIYHDLYKYTGVIESNDEQGFSSSLDSFANGNNSGHCAIQLALLKGYKKIYLLGFDLNEEGQTHFHQSYRERDQRSFRTRVSDYKTTLINALKNHKGSQEIINLSSQSALSKVPFIKTQSINDVVTMAKIQNNPNSLDDLMVVGYYTVNTPYEVEANNLISSLQRLRLNHDIVGVKNLGNWQANTRFKANFMLDMLTKWKGYRLLYVDCDAVIHRSPDLFKNYKCDIALRWQDFRWRKNECLSGTIYMENNERTRKICELWRDINVEEGNNTDRMEQWNLDTVINKMKQDPKFTYKNLPPEYTFIFDIMKKIYPEAVPVIEHFQASRRFKNKL